MSSALTANFQGSDLKLEVRSARLDALTARDLREELAMICGPTWAM